MNLPYIFNIKKLNYIKLFIFKLKQITIKLNLGGTVYD